VRTIDLQFKWDTFYEGVTSGELARCNDYKDFQDVEDASFFWRQGSIPIGVVSTIGRHKPIAEERFCHLESMQCT